MKCHAWISFDVLNYTYSLSHSLTPPLCLIPFHPYLSSSSLTQHSLLLHQQHQQHTNTVQSFSTTRFQHAGLPSKHIKIKRKQIPLHVTSAPPDPPPHHALDSHSPDIISMYGGPAIHLVLV